LGGLETFTFGHQSDIGIPENAEKPLGPSTSKPDWVDIAVVLSPLPLILVVVVAAEHFNLPATRFLVKNWGNVASVWGVAVSIYVLWVAKGARAAAANAEKEAEHAVQEAKAATRVRAALAELQGAAEKTTQIGLFTTAPKWDLVQLRAEEVMSICRATLARWGDFPSLKGPRNRLNDTATQMRSIVEEASKPQPSAEGIKRAPKVNERNVRNKKG